MTLEIREKGSDAFYREVIGVSANYRYLLKNHHRRIKDPLREYAVLLAVSAAVFTLLAVSTVFFGVGIFEGVALTGLGLASLLSALLLYRLTKAKNALMADRRTSTLTLDDNGVTLNKENSQELRFGWNNVVFVRVLREGIYFVAAEQTGMVISVAGRYGDAILPWLRENRPALEIVTGE